MEQFTLDQLHEMLKKGLNRDEAAHFLGVNKRSITVKVRARGYKSLIHFAASYKT